MLPCVGFGSVSGYGWTPATTPYYYSRTNCKVNYSAITGNSERLKTLNLYIGGTLVKSITNANELQVKTQVISSTFDSTHFDFDTSVETHIDVLSQKLINGVWVDQPWSTSLGSTTIPVRNRAVSHDQADPGPACQATINTLTGTGYDTSVYKTGSSWSALTYISDLNGATITVVGAHGSPASGCPNCIPGFSYPAFVTGTMDHVPLMQSKQGPGCTRIGNFKWAQDSIITIPAMNRPFS